jgi:hypothetical protein
MTATNSIICSIYGMYVNILRSSVIFKWTKQHDHCY